MNLTVLRHFVCKTGIITKFIQRKILSFLPAPTLPPSSTGGAAASVAFCGSNSGAQSATNTTLVYEEASIQRGGWLNARNGAFTLPLSGRYLLSFSLSTRTCGNFDLCSPTEVAIVAAVADGGGDGDGGGGGGGGGGGRMRMSVHRTYSTGAATRSRNDFEEVSNRTWLKHRQIGIFF